MNDNHRPRRPGRKRSDAARQAILDAALALVQEQGYGRLTIEGIAARAGVGKQTIYRWWPSKADVVLEAVTDTAAAEIPIPDTGTLRGDLQAFLTTSFALTQRQGVAPVLRALMAAAQLEPGFGEAFRTRFLGQRRAVLDQILERARQRGQWQPPIPQPTLIDVVFGTLWYRLLAGHAPADERLATELTQLIVGNHQPPDPTSSSVAGGHGKP